VTHDDSMQDPATPAGRVDIADSAIISIIHEAVLSCYGVVDLAPRSLGSAIVKRLGIGNATRGIGIQANDGHLHIELSVVSEYGTPIFTVAQNVMQTVKFQVERVLGMTVDRVNVNVDGLRVSNPAGSAS
jgi:uncharacterized alkaline shock family protein YloU